MSIPKSLERLLGSEFRFVNMQKDSKLLFYHDEKNNFYIVGPKNGYLDWMFYRNGPIENPIKKINTLGIPFLHIEIELLDGTTYHFYDDGGRMPRYQGTKLIQYQEIPDKDILNCDK